MIADLSAAESSLQAFTAVPHDASSGASAKDVPEAGRRATRLALASALTAEEAVRLAAAAWALLLLRSSGEQEVSFGVCSGGDTVAPLRVATVAETTCQGVLDAVQAELSHPAGPASSGPASSGSASSPGVVVGVAWSGRTICQFVAAPTTGELSLDLDAARFSEEAAAHLGAQLERALRALRETPERLVRDVVLTPDSDAARLQALNSATGDERAVSSVVERFRSVVARSPEHTALLSQQGSLSYRELDRRSDVLASSLVAGGVRLGDVVGLCSERTPAMITALLAILKAGAAYLPLERNYPKERIAVLIRDAAPRLVLCEAELRGLLPAATPVVTLADGAGSPALSAAQNSPAGSASLPEVLPEHRAYILYTSGSTGEPKGVQVTHRAIDRLVHNASFARLGPETTILQAAPVAFDASTFEIWGALLNGGKLALHPEPIPTTQGLGAAIQAFGVNTMWLTAALFNTVIDEAPQALAPLTQLLTGGEALSVMHVRKALAALPATQLINGYGPTETTTFATCYAIPRTLPDACKSIPIGGAIRRTQLYVLDEQRRQVPFGSIGELFIAGDGVSIGYLGKPELTDERFVPDPARAGARMYRTGDLVRMRLDGVVEFVGRADSQVKIRGFRIELGEIEHALQKQPGVSSAVVRAVATPGGDKRLVAYAVPAQKPLQVRALREALAAVLPEYMVPSAILEVERIPMTSNGKVDYRALPLPGRARPELGNPFVAAESVTERKLVALWQELLELDAIGVHDNLFELGANSLLVVRFVGRVERELSTKLSLVRVFQSPTVAGIAAHLGGTGTQGAQRLPKGPGASLREPVAIIGMAGRFPGAKNVAEFWSNLLAGVDSISKFGKDELDASLPRDVIENPDYVPARGVLEDVELFDAAFFGITPREAELMDPQQRILLELAWETLESGGYTPDTFPGTVGVFAGKYNNSYYSERVAKRPDLVEGFGSFLTMLANEKDYAATRIAHRLNLTGPAVSVHTACSTSLVAIVQAVQNLQLGQCDMALAGGASVTVPVKSGHVYEEGAMLSRDGHTRSFDQNASGTVFSDGAAMVLLKRLSEAQADGDTIHAVILGGAINNDGGDKASFTAPSADGQAAVIAMALRNAGVEPRSISYVETHGTATPIGDPIELEGLTRAFGSAAGEPHCAIGSVKSNIGHTVIAAGATGLIKTALALREETIPKSLWFEAPNPNLRFEGSPFYVARDKQPWPRANEPRRAGVSSFGVGGTNAHVIVEEPPVQNHVPAEREAQLLVLSAKTEASLGALCEDLARTLESGERQSLADVAFTLHAGRSKFLHRRAVWGESPADLVAGLRSSGGPRSATAKTATAGLPVAFMFPGQGSQYPGMGRALYRTSSVFRVHVDAALSALDSGLAQRLRSLVFELTPGAEARDEELEQTKVTQPALFIVEYALAQLWRSWGIEPAAMIGHSVGEFVAATLAGVMSMHDAVRLVAARGAMMQAQPAGAMLSVRLPAADVEKRLPAGVVVASDNAPQLCVVAGPTHLVQELAAELEREGIVTRALKTSHAFHSPMMEPVVAPFAELVSKVALSAPTVPFVSTATGDWITAAQATDPNYWAAHLRVAVRFATGVSRLLADTDCALLEVGPRAVLSTLAKQTTRERPRLCLPSMGDSDADAWAMLLGAAGKLWVAGAPLDTSIHGEQRRRVPCSTYRFERRRFWVDTNGGTLREDSRGETAHIGESPVDTRVAEVQSLDAGRGKEVSSALNFPELGGAAPPSQSNGPRDGERARVLGEIFGDQLRIMQHHLGLIAKSRSAHKG